MDANNSTRSWRIPFGWVRLTTSREGSTNVESEGIENPYHPLNYTIVNDLHQAINEVLHKHGVEIFRHEIRSNR